MFPHIKKKIDEKYFKSGITKKKISINKKNNAYLAKKKDHQKYHLVKPYDTIYAISKMYYCPINILLKENNIVKPYKIVIGQRILIPLCTQTQKKKMSPPSLKFIKTWDWPFEGKILHYFSNTEFGSHGIKMLVLKKNMILAASDGEVVYIGDLFKSYGKMILLKHKNNYLSVYAYLDSILVKNKQIVHINQKIATVKSSKNNLDLFYFEMRHRGEPVNPLNYLSQKQTDQ